MTNDTYQVQADSLAWERFRSAMKALDAHTERRDAISRGTIYRTNISEALASPELENMRRLDRALYGRR